MSSKYFNTLFEELKVKIIKSKMGKFNIEKNKKIYNLFLFRRTSENTHG